MATRSSGRLAATAIACTLAGAGIAAAAAPANKPAPRIAPATLAAAAREARIADADYEYGRCGDERTLEAWLRDTVRDSAARITWHGGACRLANPDNPIDSGSNWCGGATIVPKADPKHAAEIEVHFEAPVDGRPGKAYAFRAVNDDGDGPDYKRDMRSFEIGYGQRFVAGYQVPEDDCG